MKRKISIILVFAMIATMLNCGFVYADAEPLKERIDAIFTQQAKMLIDNVGTTSLQYAVIDKGEIIANGNAGVYSKIENKALDENHMYGIGSTSKMFVAVSAMKLVEMGKLDMDKPIINYLPEFKMADERYKEITARMLMNHSSGLYGSTLGNAFLYGDNDTFAHDNLLENLKTQKLKANPGEFSVYCNDGFTLLEILVEKISQMTYTDFVHKYITEPLKMNNTKTPSDDFDKKMITRMYDAGSVKELPVENVNVYGTGGIYSTALDLCKFSTIFTDNTGILSEKSVKMMEESEAKKGLWRETEDNSVEYGLGWDSVNLFPFDDYNIKALVKGGDSIYYHATLVVLPEQDLSVAILSSGGASTYNQMIATNILLEILKDKKVIDEIKPAKSFAVPDIKPIPEDLSQYMGTYATATNYFILKSTDDNKLSMTCPIIPNYPEILFIYDKEKSFISADGNIKLTLLEEKNGNNYIYLDQYSTIPGLGQMVASTYFAQKLEENKVSEDVLKAWQKRNYKAYLLVSEKYSSLSYKSLPAANVAVFDFAPGYLLGAKIVDENSAENVIQMPVLGGRDTSDYKFFTQNGIEYLNISNNIYASIDMLRPIFAGIDAKCTIQSSGYARWYIIDETSANKSIKVTSNNIGGFVIYDAMGISVFNSAIDKNIEDVKLPLGGYIVFMGTPQTQYNITITK